MILRLQISVVCLGLAAAAFSASPAEPASAEAAAAVGMSTTRDGTGYAVARSDGSVDVAGSMVFRGDLDAAPLNRPVVGISVTPSGGGYWLVGADGGVFSYGDAGFFGSTGGVTLNKPWSGWPAREVVWGTGWWPQMVASSPLATPGSTGPWPTMS